MIKISSTEAYSGFDGVDMKVAIYELEKLFSYSKKFGRKMEYQYFLEDRETIALKVYWDEKEVAVYRFKNKAKLTDTVIEKLQLK